MRRAGGVAGVALLALASAASAGDPAEKKPPYWASIASGEAMMRTGPARNYPGVWLYKRRDLPVKVVQKHENWRRIVDPDGVQGWMLVTMLSDKRTALVRPGEPRAIRVKPDASSPIQYRAEPGVVGRIDHCDESWCHIAIGKRDGWVARADLYGMDPGEVVD
ncbi:SH3 domain-containing protein [Sphingomonas sp. ASV193]|uniref:SH3 domain-containing protein n=1 Tax=Sphingomonas sp. ASV193 TaxID=3144405 RepID=UPI0032E8CD64